MHWECLNEWHYTQKCWCEKRWWWYLLHLLLRHLIWLDQASLCDVVSGVAVSNLGCPGTNCMEPLLWVPCMSKELKSTVNPTEYFFFSPWGQGLHLNCEIWECFWVWLGILSVSEGHLGLIPVYLFPISGSLQRRHKSQARREALDIPSDPPFWIFMGWDSKACRGARWA